MTDSRAPGLRLQIVLALAGLMLLAFVPLFFAVASLTRASLERALNEGARDVARVVAVDVREARRGPSRDAHVRAVLEAHVGGSVRALTLAAPEGTITVRDPAPPPRGASGSFRVDEAIEPDATLSLEMVDVSTTSSAPLVRLVALYMGIFAVALLTFAYFSLTRLIVRPVESLGRAAEKVADGARTLALPAAGARELHDLGESVKTMASRLIAEESKLRTKVDELTETTRRLTEARAQVARSERMASVGRLAAGLAHEVGNPLAAILGMQELMLDGGLDGATEKDFVRRMKSETERINGVVRDLLDFARPEEPPSSAQMVAAGALVHQVVDDVAALVRPQKEFKSLTVEIDVAEGMRVALAAPRLTQVLLNLVLNAGVAARSRVGMRASRVDEGARVRIVVEDDGPGVPASMREQIFEPFVTTKEVGTGTGLGLSVCRGIVEAAGGTIAVDASYDAGARFVVELPASPV